MVASQLAIGVVLIALTVLIHATFLHELLSFVKRIAPTVRETTHRAWKIVMLTIAVLGIFASHTIQVWLWALFYFFMNILPSFEEALYFSVITFSTVGYGDIVLDENWRLLSGLQSANGLLLFGWSTAFIFETMSMLYKTKSLETKK